MKSSNHSSRRYTTDVQSHRRQLPSQSEAIVDKLHGAIASLRRERDDLHRSKEVAVERLRLVKQERMNTEKSVKVMQETYNGLMTSLSDGSHGSEGGVINTATNNGNSGSSVEQKEIQQLKQEVEHLSREGKFEHAELVDKKQKVDQVRQQLKEQEENRTLQLRMARDALRKRREKMVLRNAAKKHKKQQNHLSKNQDVDENNVDVEGAEKMQTMLREDPNEDLIKSLPRLISKAAESIVGETDTIYSDSEILMRRIAGYERYINGIQTS